MEIISKNSNLIVLGKTLDQHDIKFTGEYKPVKKITIVAIIIHTLS